jgi:hypothetical protein
MIGNVAAANVRRSTHVLLEECLHIFCGLLVERAPIYWARKQVPSMCLVV